MNICVFCSAVDIDKKYEEPAIEFATYIGEKGHALVWGGSDTGLMGKIATAAENAGAKLVGVSVELLKHSVRKNATEMLIAKDIGERKATMLMRSDVLAVLPGGLGTLDEMTDVLEQRKHRLHNKLIVVLNIDGFYEGLKNQLERMAREGFLRQEPLEDLIRFADTPQEAMWHIESI